MATEQASGGEKFRPVTPMAGKGDAFILLDSTSLTTDPNSASSIVDLKDSRCVTLWITASVDAANAVAHIIPLVSAAATVPVIGDDSWFGLCERDAVATATLLTGSLPTGADYTIAPEWAAITVRPLFIRTELGDGASDEIRIAVTLNVAHAKWFYVTCEELTGNMTLAIKYNLHG